LLAPDLVVVEYRQEPFESENVFAAVEIKFPGDWVKQKQIDQYAELMEPRTGVNREKNWSGEKWPCYAFRRIALALKRITNSPRHPKAPKTGGEREYNPWFV